jgi:hypothetical protein
MKFNQFFQKCLQKKATFLTVGIDPDPEKLPAGFAHTLQGVYNFCWEVIRVTADLTLTAICLSTYSISWFFHMPFLISLSPTICWANRYSKEIKKATRNPIE